MLQIKQRLEQRVVPSTPRRRRGMQSAVMHLLFAVQLVQGLLLGPVPLQSVSRQWSPVVMCATESGDALLMSAMQSLKEKNGLEAQRKLLLATDAYSAQDGGPSDEQTQLLSLVQARVETALQTRVNSDVKRPPPPTPEELKARTEAKMSGERALMKAVSVFADKSDGDRFSKALALLEESRTSFREAGSEVEREREPVLGNLYAVIRAESERSDRVAKLVRMKKLLELTKQKKKAETLGIDGDAFVESVAAPDDEVPAAPVSADSILAAWKEEGLDAESQEIEKLQYAIDDLEGTLGQD